MAFSFSAITADLSATLQMTNLSAAVYDPQRGAIHMVSSDGVLQTYNIATKSYGSTVQLGGRPTSIDITTEQRTEIRNVIVETKAEPVKLDIDVNVGVIVPRTVELRPLPPRIIEIVPAYRGYEYFVLVDGRIIIVEPGTLKVVYVISA